MGALTNYYVDPSGGDDTRSASEAQVVSTPWMTFSHAIDTITRDATNGDQINIKDSAEDNSMASGSVNLADYGAPTQAAPLVIRGYSTAANDGGFGEFTGGVASTGGTVNMFEFSGTADAHDMSNVHWIDMEIGKQGRNRKIFNFSGLTPKPGNWSFRRCKLGFNCSILARSYAAYMSFQFHDCAFHCNVLQNKGAGRSSVGFNGCASLSHYYSISQSYLLDVTKGVFHITNCISKKTNSYDSATLVKMEGGSANDAVCFIRNCSFYTNTSSGSPELIEMGRGSRLHFTNNLVEGFSGSGDDVISNEGGDTDGIFLVETGGNAGYNNTNWINSNITTLKSWGDDEVEPSVSQLASSPFTDAPNSDFSPVDVGNVHGGSLPTMIGGSVPLNLDKGAIQRSAGVATYGAPIERGLHPIEWGSV